MHDVSFNGKNFLVRGNHERCLTNKRHGQIVGRVKYRAVTFDMTTLVNDMQINMYTY